MTKTILFFAPHPDDAEFYAGGTLSRMTAEGNKLYIITVTDGSKGSLDLDAETLIATRREEAGRGASVLGAEPPVFLGYSDFELDQVPKHELREHFIRLIRQYKPDVIFAEDPFVDEIHPDHRAVAWAAHEAIQYAGLPLLCPHHLEEGLMPHVCTEKYFYSGNLDNANKFVDISTTFEKKIAAVAEHRSQVKFLVDEFYDQARQAGLDLNQILGDIASDRLAVLTYSLQAEAIEAGKRGNVQMGEAFRFVRFHPYIEMILETREK
jgi:LmbE family N-acetylglucosaminyl deacetylase